MNYIDFKLTKNNEIIASYVDGEKITILTCKHAKEVYKKIKKDKIEPHKIISNGEQIIRYNNVKKYINYNNVKKIKWENTLVPSTVVISSLLSLIMVVNAYGNNKKIDKSDTSNKDTVTYTEESFDNKTLIEEQMIEIPEEIIIDKYFDFEFKDNASSEELKYVKTNYYEWIEKYSKMYGISPNLITAMISCESKGNSNITSGAGAYGLLQIKAEGEWNWVGKQLTVYNFETNEFETVTICLNSDGELKRKMLFDPEYNIKIGCMIMANNLASANYDILCAIQTYNTGMKPIYLKKEYGEEWINYRKEYLDGSTYIEYVLSYIEKEDNIITCYDIENNSYNICVNNVYKPYVKQK